MLRGLSLLAAVGFLVVGCASAAPEDSRTDPDSSVTEAEAPGAQGFSIADMLAVAPRLEGNLLISAADVTRAAELAGAPRATESGTALAAWLTELAGVGSEHVVSVPWPASLSLELGGVDGEFADAVGFDVRDVDAFLEVSAPPSRFLVADGRFDTEAIATALGEPQDEIWVQPGEELAPNLAERGRGDALGRPVRVTGDDDRLVVSLELAHAEHFRDSLASDWDALMSVAEALDAEGAYSALLWDSGDDVGGIGLTVEGETVIVRHAGTDGEAAALAETLTGVTDGRFSVRESVASGALVTLWLDAEAGAPPASAWQVPMMHGPLVN